LRQGRGATGRSGDRLLPHRPANDRHAIRRALPRSSGAALRRLVRGLVAPRGLSRRESGGAEEAVSPMTSRKPRPYANPYLAGVALGLVLLAAFVIMGRGLGASGAFASTAAGVVSAEIGRASGRKRRECRVAYGGVKE